MNSVTPVSCFRSSRNHSVQPEHPTRCHRFHNRKNSLPLILCFFWSSSTQWFLSSTSITFDLLLCSVTQGPNPFVTKLQKNPSWKLMSKGEREINQSLIISIGGECKKPQMLGVQEERSHMSLRGERHVHIWLFALALFSFFALIFYSLSSPSIPC